MIDNYIYRIVSVKEEICTSNKDETTNDDLLPERNFNYCQAKPNRVALRGDQRVIVFDPDMAEYFKDSESVNRFLRALIGNIPQAV